MKNINDSIIKSLINKLFDKSISKDELEVLNNWYDSESNVEEVEVFNSSSDNKANVKNELLKRINAKRKRTPQIYVLFSKYRNVAATLLAFALLVSGIMIYMNSQKTEPEIAWNEIKVLDGQKKILTLSDNSKITINSGSYFKYPQQFSPINSEVYLDGEAYFEITPNKKRNFIVHTAKFSTSVLGTKFNISAFKEDIEESVSLIEGKVEVMHKSSSKSNSTILKPLEQFFVNNNSNVSSVRKFDVDEEIGWKENNLVYKSKPLKQILRSLSRSYGVKFVLTNDDLANKNITANFKETKLSTVIRSIEKLTNLRSYTEKDEDINLIVFY